MKNAYHCLLATHAGIIRYGTVTGESERKHSPYMVWNRESEVKVRESLSAGHMPRFKGLIMKPDMLIFEAPLTNFL